MACILDNGCIRMVAILLTSQDEIHPRKAAQIGLSNDLFKGKPIGQTDEPSA